MTTPATIASERFEIQGEEAELFPKHCYLVPIMEPVEIEVDHIKVIPGRDYPRWLVRPSSSHRTRFACDCEVRFKYDQNTARIKADAFVTPSPYSDTPEERIAFGEADLTISRRHFAAELIRYAINERRI